MVSILFRFIISSSFLFSITESSHQIHISVHLSFRIFHPFLFCLYFLHPFLCLHLICHNIKYIPTPTSHSFQYKMNFPLILDIHTEHIKPPFLAPTFCFVILMTQEYSSSVFLILMTHPTLILVTQIRTFLASFHRYPTYFRF